MSSGLRSAGAPSPNGGFTWESAATTVAWRGVTARAPSADCCTRATPAVHGIESVVTTTPRAVSASNNTVSFADGTQLRVDAVVWATGYQPDYSWIETPVLDAGGRVRHHRGVSDLPGLYFLGLYWQHTRGSALLGWVKDDAEYIATRIQILAESRKLPPDVAIRSRPNAGTDQEEPSHVEPQ